MFAFAYLFHFSTDINNLSCMLNNEKVFEFRSYYEEFMKPKEIKSKKLQDAIEMALKILNGQSTY